MPNEQTNKTDTAGEEDNKPTENPKELNPILAEAKTLAETIVEGNKRHEDLLSKQEQLLAEMALGGSAGGRVDSKPHVETSKEYADKVMNGDVKND